MIERKNHGFFFPSQSKIVFSLNQDTENVTYISIIIGENI